MCFRVVSLAVSFQSQWVNLGYMVQLTCIKSQQPYLQWWGCILGTRMVPAYLPWQMPSGIAGTIKKNIAGHLSGPQKAEPGGRTTFRSLCEIASSLMICSLALSPMYWDPLGALLGIRWNIKNSQVHFSAETWAVTTVSNMANINDILSLEKGGD